MPDESIVQLFRALFPVALRALAVLIQATIAALTAVVPAWLPVALQALALLIQAVIAAVAIWQDRIRAFFGRPKLVLSAKLAEPDCDLTRFSPPYQVKDGAEVKAKYASCYYLRLRVRNTGQRLAEKAEVYVENVEMKKHGFSNAK